MTYEEASHILCFGDVPSSDDGIAMVLDLSCRDFDLLILGARTLENWPVIEKEPEDGGEIYEGEDTPW